MEILNFVTRGISNGFGSSRLIIFIVLSNSVGLEIFMSLLKILCFFDLDSEDLGDETSAK